MSALRPALTGSARSLAAFSTRILWAGTPSAKPAEMLTQTVAFLAAAAIAAPGIARFSERSFEDFETCYGSYEGASSVLPILKDSMPPDDAAAVQHAMDNLGSDFM